MDKSAGELYCRVRRAGQRGGRAGADGGGGGVSGGRNNSRKYLHRSEQSHSVVAHAYTCALT